VIMFTNAYNIKGGLMWYSLISAWLSIENIYEDACDGDLESM